LTKLLNRAYLAQPSTMGTYDATIDPRRGKLTRLPPACRARIRPTSQTMNQMIHQSVARIASGKKMIEGGRSRNCS
jgi:hypothetical protein